MRLYQSFIIKQPFLLQYDNKEDQQDKKISRLERELEEVSDIISFLLACSFVARPSSGMIAQSYPRSQEIGGVVFKRGMEKRPFDTILSVDADMIGGFG